MVEAIVLASMVYVFTFLLMIYEAVFNKDREALIYILVLILLGLLAWGVIGT